MIVLCIVLLSVVGLCFCLWITDVYRLLPGWGPIRKFESDGSEDMRQRQVALYQHVRAFEAQQRLVAAKAHEEQEYGAIGKPTWGTCESANKNRTPILHPVLGHVQVRDGFAETQQMRADSEWWARDEHHFMAERGHKGPSLRINEVYAHTANMTN